MHMLNRFVSSVVLAVFFITTVLTDISFADPAKATLAVKSLCDDIGGIEHQDGGRIKVAFQEILTVVSESHAAGVSITPLTLATILSDMSRQQPSVFAPPDMQFMYHMMTIAPETGEWHIECRVTDEAPDQGTPRKYHVLFSFAKDELGGFPLRVVPDAEYTGSFGAASIGRPRDGHGRFEKAPGKSPEDVWLMIILAGLNERFEFTIDDLVVAYNAVNERAKILRYSFDPLAPKNPTGILRLDLEELVKRGMLSVVKVGATNRFRVAEAYRAETAYAVNFRAFAGIAEYAARELGFTGVDYTESRRLVAERLRKENTVRDRIVFDLVTGTLSFVTSGSPAAEEAAMSGSRLEFGAQESLLRNAALTAEPFRYAYRRGSPIVGVIAAADGSISLVVTSDYYKAFMAHAGLTPLVTITAEGGRIGAGEVLLAPAEQGSVALEPKPSPSTDGRFRPGKDPLSVLRIISLDPSLQNEPVTVVDLLAAYQDWGAVLGYDELAPSRPDDTMLRDVKKLVSNGCLASAKGVRGGYTLTAHGRKMIAGYREENKRLLETDLNDLIPRTLSYEAEIAPLRKLAVGVPKEIKPFAERVGMTPAGVKVLVSYGVRVIVERGAGREHFSDDAYRAAGAIMVNTPGEVWAQADIIKKVKEPLESKDLGINELELMRPGQIVYTYLHLASPDCKELTYTLARKKVTGIAFETIVTEENGRPVTPALRPMSIIAGNLGGYFGVIYSLWSDVVDEGGRKVVRLTAVGRKMMGRVKADYLNAQGFRRVAKGKAAVVLGGGVSGVRMAKILLKLGVSVTITDASPARVEELKRIFTIYGKQAEVALVSKDMNDVSPELLSKLKQADILGGCVLVPGAVAPQMNEWLLRTISEDRFGGKPKAIIDIAIDQGGNFYGAHSTYYSDPAFSDEHGNKRFCVANMPDFVGGVASVELEKTTLVYNLALALGFDRAIAMFPELAGGVNMYDGYLAIETLHELYPDIPEASVPQGAREAAAFVSDRTVTDTIAAAIAAAPDAARVIPTHPSTRFTLLVDYSFHKDNAELTGDMNGYVDDGGKVVAAGDRFDVERVEASNIENILARVKDPARTVVQVSTTLTEGDLATLKARAPGIRIVRVNTDEIRAATHDITDSAERQKNRFDMYAAMLAVRSLTPEELQNRAGGNYRILAFYVKTHFALSEGLTIDDYINAIATDDLTRLIKGHLAYRPIQVYRVPDYNSVAAALISA